MVRSSCSAEDHGSSRNALCCAAGSWSSPAFFKFHGVGGGLTLGVSRADTVIVLNSDRALAQYQSADFNFKFGGLLSAPQLAGPSPPVLFFSYRLL